MGDRSLMKPILLFDTHRLFRAKAIICHLWKQYALCSSHNRTMSLPLFALYWAPLVRCTSHMFKPSDLSSSRWNPPGLFHVLYNITNLWTLKTRCCLSTLCMFCLAMATGLSSCMLLSASQTQTRLFRESTIWSLLLARSYDDSGLIRWYLRVMCSLLDFYISGCNNQTFSIRQSTRQLF